MKVGKKTYRLSSDPVQFVSFWHASRLVVKVFATDSGSETPFCRHQITIALQRSGLLWFQGQKLWPKPYDPFNSQGSGYRLSYIAIRKVNYYRFTLDQLGDFLARFKIRKPQIVDFYIRPLIQKELSMLFFDRLSSQIRLSQSESSKQPSDYDSDFLPNKPLVFAGVISLIVSYGLLNKLLNKLHFQREHFDTTAYAMGIVGCVILFAVSFIEIAYGLSLL